MQGVCQYACMCVNVCVCTCTWVCVNVCVCVHVHGCVSMCVWLWVHVCMYACVFLHMCVSAHVFVYVYLTECVIVCVCVCVSVYHCMWVCQCVCDVHACSANWHNTDTHVDHTHSFTHLHQDQHSYNHVVRSASSVIMLKKRNCLVCVIAPEGRLGFLMSPPCLESQGC